ncbi:unnamed protein product [Ectocarpus sp. 4 AP-2014]
MPPHIDPRLQQRLVLLLPGVDPCSGILSPLITVYSLEESVRCDIGVRPLTAVPFAHISTQRLVVVETPHPPSTAFSHRLRASPFFSPVPTEPLSHRVDGSRPLRARTGQLRCQPTRGQLNQLQTVLDAVPSQPHGRATILDHHPPVPPEVELQRHRVRWCP